jgi:hypothetical protein
MISSDVTVETSEEVKKWLECCRRWVINPDTQYHETLIDEVVAAEKNYVVVPLLDCWMPDDNSGIISRLRSMGCERLYSCGLILEDLYMSAVVDHESIGNMLMAQCRHALLVPKNAEFYVLHTPFDYWLIAGPASLIQDLLGNTVEKCFSLFLKGVEEEAVVEAGSDFAHSIVARYERHNQTLGMQ